MKTFKALVFAGIFAGLSVNCAYADDIEDVVMVDEDTVEITGTLTGCLERPIAAETTCEDNVYTIKLTAEPQAAEDPSCLDETNAFYQSFTLPEDSQATGILVQLISGVDEDEVFIIRDFEELDQEEIILDVCADECAIDLEQCKVDCDTDTTCMAGCEVDSEECLADCEKIIEDVCADECAIDLEQCNVDCGTDTTCTDDCAGDSECIEACDALCDADCQIRNDDCIATCGEPATALLCTPETLNLKSNGRWITCLVQSADITVVEDVDLDSIRLNGDILVEKACMQEDLLMLKFSRPDLIESLSGDEEMEFPMETELVVTGEMSDGSLFEGMDTIRVIYPQPKEEQVKAQKKEKTNKANKKGKK